MRRLFRLQNKSDNSHKYYGSLSALCSDNLDLGVSKFTLDRFDFFAQGSEAQRIITEINIIYNNENFTVLQACEKWAFIYL